MSTISNEGRALTDEEVWLLTAGPIVIGYKILEEEGLADLLTQMTEKRRGRKICGLTIVDALAWIIGSSLDGGGTATFRQAAEAASKHLSNQELSDLGITQRWPAAQMTGPRRRAQRHTIEELVARRIRSLVERLDLYEGQRNKRATVADLLAYCVEIADDEVITQRREANRALLALVCNKIIQGSLSLIPEILMQQFPDIVAGDGTFTSTWGTSPQGHASFSTLLAAVNRARSIHPKWTAQEIAAEVLRIKKKQSTGIVAADPEAGWYTREERSKEDKTKTVEIKGFGYEIHGLMTYKAGEEEGVVVFPGLAVAMVLDTPHFRPGPNAILAIQEFKEWADARGLTPKVFVGDALYPGLGIDTFHQPLREEGLRYIARLYDGHFGRSGIAYKGLMLVEGAWYCAKMPAKFIDASKDFEAKLIDEDKYYELIEGRKAFQAYRVSGSAVLNPDGTIKSHRYKCPCSRPVDPRGCKRKPASLHQGRPLLPIAAVSKSAQADLPAACTQETVEIPAELGIGLEQAAPYMSKEWRAINDKYRPMNEGRHGTIKAQSGQAIAVEGSRRMHGLAANSLLTACQLAASNVDAIRNFLWEAHPNSDGVLERHYSTYRQDRAAAKKAAKSTSKLTVTNTGVGSRKASARAKAVKK